MAINLQKGQRETLNAPKFTIGLGWDTNASSTGAAFDLDASVFIMGENKKILSDEHFIFYNNLKSPDEAVEHTGDNLTGDGDGDDEQILVDLSKIDPRTSEICIVVTIHDAEDRKQNKMQYVLLSFRFLPKHLLQKVKVLVHHQDHQTNQNPSRRFLLLSLHKLVRPYFDLDVAQLRLFPTAPETYSQT